MVPRDCFRGGRHCFCWVHNIGCHIVDFMVSGVLRLYIGYHSPLYDWKSLLHFTFWMRHCVIHLIIKSTYTLLPLWRYMELSSPDGIAGRIDIHTSLCTFPLCSICAPSLLSVASVSSGRTGLLLLVVRLSDVDFHPIFATRPRAGLRTEYDRGYIACDIFFEHIILEFW